MINPRTLAAKILLQVIDDKRSLTAALTGVPLKNTQINLVKELCFGVCRWHFRLTALLEGLLAKPLRDKDQDIQMLLLIGLYQLLYLRVPDHAAVLETVEAARTLKKPWATKLINGVLRTFLRQRETRLASVDNTLIGRYAHPKWLIDRILAAWPEQGESILAANNAHPPLCLRINALKISREAYLHHLSEQAIVAFPVEDSPSALMLEKPQDVVQLPGFQEGHFFVQDSSAQFAAGLLDLSPGQRVLDACAAPGGKTTHILEIEPQLGALIVVDKEAVRLDRVRENVQRLGMSAPLTWHVADAAHTSTWWDGQLFDRILLDAPCSGTGVIRRHPDIKILRQPADIAQLASQQYALLCALWPTLKPGGLLVYATCSILPDENQQLIAAFLEQHADVQEKTIEASWGVDAQPGRQILPGMKNRDGFYYARLVKV